MTRFKVDMNIAFVQHLRRRGADRRNHGSMQTVTQIIDNVQVIRHSQHVDDLMGAGQQQHVSLAGCHRSNVLFQRSRVFGKFPSIDSNRLNRRPTCFQPRDQRCVGDAVFLKPNDLVGDRDICIDRLQQFSPRVRFGHTIGRRQIRLPASRLPVWGHGKW